MRRVATAVAQGAIPSSVFTAVVAEIADLLDADLTLIGRYELDATFSYLAVGGSISRSWDSIRLSLGGINLASKILDSRQPESMNYDNASGPIAVFARGLGLHSAVGTPIVVDGQMWGAMFACWARPQRSRRRRWTGYPRSPTWLPPLSRTPTAEPLLSNHVPVSWRPVMRAGAGSSVIFMTVPNSG